MRLVLATLVLLAAFIGPTARDTRHPCRINLVVRTWVPRCTHASPWT